jgi:hypothetical protein
MSSQRFRKGKADPDFDLDAYLQEKSHPDEQFEEQINDSPKSSFLKNTVLILGLSIFALLYFNEWSPKLVYGNIFGIEEYQKQSIAPEPVVPVTTNSETEAMVAENNISGFNDITVNTQQLENLANLEVLEGLEALEALEALESLEGLASLENLEGLEGLEELAKLSALEALSNLGNSSFIQIENNSSEFPASLADYKTELKDTELTDEFDTETVAELYEAKVPVSVLATLKNNGLLSTVDVSSLIEGYKNQGN